MQADADTPTRRRRARYRYALPRALGHTLLYLILLLGAATMLMPLYWMVISSLKANQHVFDLPPQLLPVNPQWGNYPEALTTLPFGTFLTKGRRKTTISHDVYTFLTWRCLTSPHKGREQWN